MKFEEILPALREGKKITSKHLRDYGYLYIYYNYKSIFADSGEFVHLPDGVLEEQIIESDDWEIFQEPKKIKLRDLTAMQFVKRKDKNCGEDCYNCVFNNIDCRITYSSCWIHHKDLYNDKFLDQEVEIEE